MSLNCNNCADSQSLHRSGHNPPDIVLLMVLN
jgi:hypothetical protein